MPETACILCRRLPTPDLSWPQVCPACVDRTRSNLIAVERDYALLEAEMLEHVGAATPPDPTGRHGDNDHIPGANIMVMLGPGSTRPHSDPVDIDSILGVLERWDRDWRITFREPAAREPATISNVIIYLTRRLMRAAAEHPAFDEFHQDTRIMRLWLQIALRSQPQIAPVPCYCGRFGLERAMPREDGKPVEWRCDHCHREYDYDQFNLLWRESEQAV